MLLPLFVVYFKVISDLGINWFGDLICQKPQLSISPSPPPVCQISSLNRFYLEIWHVTAEQVGAGHCLQ